MLKRGISPLISTILLIGVTFVIGLVVFASGIDILKVLMKEPTTSVQEQEVLGEGETPEPLITSNIIEYGDIETYEERYIYAHDLLALNKDNSIVYLTKDYLGSTRAVSDSNGNVVYSQGYYPYGSEINSNKDDVSYSGKQLDKDTGLYYYGARYYAPTIGRFTQLDPIDSSNSPYMAFNNNPMKFVDPDGKEPNLPYFEGWKWVEMTFNPEDLTPTHRLNKNALDAIAKRGGRSLDPIQSLPWAGPVKGGYQVFQGHHRTSYQFNLNGEATIYAAVLDEEAITKMGEEYLVHQRTFGVKISREEATKIIRDDVSKRFENLAEFYSNRYQNVPKNFAEALDPNNMDFGPIAGKSSSRLKKIGRIIPGVGIGLGLVSAYSEARASNYGRAGLTCLGAFCDPVDYGMFAYDYFSMSPIESVVYPTYTHGGVSYSIAEPDALSN